MRLNHWGGDIALINAVSFYFSVQNFKTEKTNKILNSTTEEKTTATTEQDKKKMVMDKNWMWY